MKKRIIEKQNEREWEWERQGGKRQKKKIIKEKEIKWQSDNTKKNENERKNEREWERMRETMRKKTKEKNIRVR